MIVRLIRFLPVIAWMALIFVMSSREQVPQPFGLSAYVLAIAGHLFLYGVLALLVLFAVEGHRRPTLSTQLLAILVAALYGVTDEIHQSFVPGRDASSFDLIVNLAGAMIAVVAWTHLRPIVEEVTSR